MKVLKRVPWSYKFTCKGCKSVLEAEGSDVREGRFGGVAYAGELGDLHFYVQCSVCGTDRIINDKDVPQDIQNSAKRDKD